MGNPIRRAYTPLDSGPQAPFPLDWLPVAQTTIGVFIVDGAATFGIEWTLDDVNDPAVTPRWFPSEEIPAGTAATKYAAVHNPWLFGRINFSLITGNVELKVQQAFTTGNRY